MKWSNQFELGIPEIDQQHRHILTAITALEDAVLKNTVGELLDKVLIALEAYSRQHFDFEEKKLEQSNYPRLLIQLNAHASFILKIKEFKDDIRKATNPRQMGLKICNYLREWFVNHILEEDQQYLSYLR